MKNYIGFVNDHSGSMSSLARAAVTDYNATIGAVREAASREMLDTVVSVVGIGLGNNGYGVQRQVVISNPHVLRPLTSWPTPGGTPLYDGVGEMIELFESLPDYSNPDVSFLVVTTTDGQEQHSSRYNASKLTAKLRSLQDSGRWTFVFRVPKGSAHTISKLGVPLDNIQEWGTTTQGMAESTAATTKAFDTYFAARTSGARGSNTFYAQAGAVNASTVKATLKDVSAELSMWTVLDDENGIEIEPFAKKRLGPQPFLKGAAFYQLTKTEARVQDSKLIAIRDKSNGHVYSGDAARALIGLPASGNNGAVRLHPGDHGGYDIFIQSTSINRKLVSGTQVLYWPAKGSGFTAADFPWLTNGQSKPGDALSQRAAAIVGAPAVAAVQATASIGPVVSPAPATKPTKSPLVTSSKRTFFLTRDGARVQARHLKVPMGDAGKFNPPGKRWYVEA